MALSANTIFEIRTAGDNNAGGGFVAGASGTDYSQQNAIHATRADLVIDGTIDTDITSAADNFASDIALCIIGSRRLSVGSIKDSNFALVSSIVK